MKLNMNKSVLDVLDEWADDRLKDLFTVYWNESITDAKHSIDRFRKGFVTLKQTREELAKELKS